jgi:flagellar motility protein MotE (MotC chaperone)
MTRRHGPKKAAAGHRRRAGRGALLILATLLGVSGFLRLVEATGGAFALASDATVPADAVEPAAPDAIALLEAVKERERKVSEREARLDARIEALKSTEERVEKQLAALSAAEEDLARTVAIADGAAEQDVARLVAFYEAMKPKDAARLFNEMAPEFAVGFLARMRPDAAAAVLAGLDPKAAYSISVLMAGRNANAPRQ